MGEAGVGKHSLVRRFVDRQFSDKYLAALGVTIYCKTLELPGLKPQDKLNLQLIIWDITGNLKYQTLVYSYLRGSSGALVVADASRIDTIERLPEHIQLFSSVNPQGFIIVVLNKSDLVNQEELTQRVQRVQLKKWERVLGIYQISAKTGSSVDEIFQQLACRSLESL
jgi:small GTP-binding protein